MLKRLHIFNQKARQEQFWIIHLIVFRCIEIFATENFLSAPTKRDPIYSGCDHTRSSPLLTNLLRHESSFNIRLWIYIKPFVFNGSLQFNLANLCLYVAVLAIVYRSSILSKINCLSKPVTGQSGHPIGGYFHCICPHIFSQSRFIFSLNKDSYFLSIKIHISSQSRFIFSLNQDSYFLSIKNTCRYQIPVS